MQPTTPTSEPLKTKKFPGQRHFLAVFFISFSWGMFGVDRMYLGKWGTGFLKLITAGGFGIWTIIDLILIMGGSMRDKWGREMREFHEYKQLSYRVVLVFAVVLGLITLIGGIILITVVMQFIGDYQNGTLTIPGLDLLQAPGLSPEQRTEFGL